MKPREKDDDSLTGLHCKLVLQPSKKESSKEKGKVTVEQE